MITDIGIFSVNFSPLIANLNLADLIIASTAIPFAILQVSLSGRQDRMVTDNASTRSNH